MDNEFQKAFLEKCVDGDTAVFKVGEEQVKYRFLAVDTPESVHPKKKEENYGKLVSEYTCDTLSNAEEILIETEKNVTTDKYGRSLAWIWVDGELIQKKLVEQGYAEVAYIYGNYKYTLNLCAIQKEAISKKINIWSDKKREEGYCKNKDITDVSRDIVLNIPIIEQSVENKNELNIIPYILVIVIFLIYLCFNPNFRKKFLKKMAKKIKKR